jgi:hypothetical protein
MAGDREPGEMFPRYEVLGEKGSSLDEMTTEWEDFDEGGYQRWDRKKAAPLKELFTKIYVAILACSVALFGSALLVLRSTSPDNQLSSALAARSVAPQDATTTTISTTMTFSTTTIISSLSGSSSTSTASSASTTPVQIFQVFSPVLGSTGLIGSNGPVANANATEASATICQVTLMEHSFASSFGKPFVGMRRALILTERERLKWRIRKLYPTGMYGQCEYCDDEFLCHFSRSSV